eukprot:69_1
MGTVHRQREINFSSEDDTDEETIHVAMNELIKKYNIDEDRVQSHSMKQVQQKHQDFVTLVQQKCSFQLNDSISKDQIKKVQVNWSDDACDIFKRNNLSFNSNIDHYYNSEHDSDWEWTENHERDTERINNSFWLQSSKYFTGKQQMDYNRWRSNEWNRIHRLRRKHKRKLHPNHLNRIYELEIHFIGIYPRINRRIRIQSYVSLAVFHDKILSPLFGFKRNFHAYQFRKKHYKYKRIAYGPQMSQSVDMMHIHQVSGIRKLGGCMLEAQFIRLNDVLVSVGDGIRYDYDLGQRYEMNIELVDIMDINDDAKLVEIMDGNRAGPPENMEGNRGWVERLNILKGLDYTHTQDKFIETVHEIINSPNIVSSKSVYDSEVFDKRKCVEDIRKCFQTVLSKQSAFYQVHPVNCRKEDAGFKFIYKQLHFTPRICHNPRCRKLNGNTMRRSEQDMKMDKKFKICLKCLSAFYCNRHCQKIHWKLGHRVYCLDRTAI